MRGWLEIDREEYNLPEVMAKHGYSQETTVEDPKFVNRLLDRKRRDDNFDVIKNDTVAYLGDGKNVYRLEYGDGARSDILPDNKIEVVAKCLGVCNPDDYRQIDEELGFNAVLDFLDGRHRSAIWYEEEKGFIKPEDDENSQEESFYSWNNAERVKEEVN